MPARPPSLQQTPAGLQRTERGQRNRAPLRPANPDLTRPGIYLVGPFPRFGVPQIAVLYYVDESIRGAKPRLGQKFLRHHLLCDGCLDVIDVGYSFMISRFRRSARSITCHDGCCYMLSIKGQVAACVH